VHTITGGSGAIRTKETKVIENIVNGGREEADDVALAKSKVARSTQETITVSSHYTSSTTATAE